MKRFTAKLLCVLLLLLLTLSGCSDPYAQLADTYNAETDQPASFVPLFSNTFAIAPGEGGYYFIMSDFLFFADPETEISVPVCSKAECRHYEETDPQKVWLCNAFVGSSAAPSFLQFYEGNLYCISSAGSVNGELTLFPKTELLRVSPDGTVHDYLFPVDAVLQFAAIHRGYLYYAPVDEKYRLYRQKMDGNGEEELVFEAPNASVDTFFWGNRAYMQYFEDGAVVCTTYHIQTGEVKEVETNGYRWMRPFEDGIICRKISGKDSTFGRYDMATGTIEELCTLEDETDTYAYAEYDTDGTYLYQFRRPVGFFEQEEGYNRDNGELKMAVYDLTGKELAVTDLAELPAVICFAPGDENCGVFWYEKIKEEEMPMYLTLLKKQENYRMANVFKHGYAPLRPDLMS